MRTLSFSSMTFYLSLLFLSGCSGDVVSPEDRIREMLSAGEKAVEGRDGVETSVYR